MHFFDKENYFFGGHGIVGAQIGTGAGLAFAEKYNETGNVAVCFFGDGAVRQGMVHEIFNLAMLWSLPVIFICENNYYAMGTSVKRSSNLETIHHLGDAYGMPNSIVDGMRCEDVYHAVAKAAEHARQGNGPTFLEIQTYRYKGHSMSDPQKYRTKDELEEYKLKDPIETTLKTIYDKKFATEQEIEAINEKIKAQVDACVEFAENSPYPDASEMYTDNYVQQDYPFIMD
jgi:pyruvate dehydrogenase E1 component alpha subunit